MFLYMNQVKYQGWQLSMKYFYNEFEVNSNIEKVWGFYTDLKASWDN